MRTSLWRLALVFGYTVSASASWAQPIVAKSAAFPGPVLNRDRTTAGTGTGDTLVISRQSAIALALRSNPQVAIAREQLAQAHAQSVQATAIDDPVFTGVLDSVTGIRRAGAAPQRPVALSASVPFPDKLRLRHRVGSANVDSYDAALLLVQQQLASDAGQLYDHVLVVRRHQRDLLQSRELSNEFLKRTEARFNAGTVPRLDVIKAQVDVAQAENDLIANMRDVANADAALNRVLGRPLGAVVIASDSLGVPPALPDLDALETIALKARPELRDIEAQQRGARASSSLARENAFLPDITLGAGRDEAVPSGIVYSVGISMPIPIMFWQHTRGDFAENKHRELELAATSRDIRAAIAQDIRSAYAAADAARRQVVFLRDQLLPSATEAYRISSVSYGLGGLSALEVLDARRTLLSAQSQYADALAAANSSRSELERALGAPLSTLSAGSSRE